MRTALRSIFLLAPIAVVIAAASSCSLPFAKDIQQYSARRPALDFETYFRGRTVGYGQITSASGRITQEFTVVIDGVVEGDDLLLYETFHFLDGRSVRRVWRVHRANATEYTAQADDVSGGATGRSMGNAVRWRYQLNTIHFNGSDTVITLDDWMFRQSEQIVINRARMSKLGLPVGEMLIVFDKSASDVTEPETQ